MAPARGADSARRRTVIVCARAIIRSSVVALVAASMCSAPARAASELKENPDPVLREVEAAVRQGDLERALAIVGEAIRKKPAASYHLERASLLVVKGDRTAAGEDFNAAVALDPEFTEARMQRGLFLADLGDADAALADFDRAIALDPKRVSPFLARGSTYLGVGRIDAAIADFATALRLDPQDPEAWTRRASAQLARRDWDAAIADCTVALKLHPKKIAALNHRGGAWLGRQEPRKALADFEAVLAIEPHNAVALIYRAQIRRLRGDLFHALEDASEAIRSDAHNPAAYNERASIRAALGDVAAAIGDCTTALLVGGPNEQTLLLRAMLSMQRADYARARADFDQLLGGDSGLAGVARVHLAWLLATCPDDTVRDGARASRLAHEATARATAPDPVALDALAAACAELGDFAGALVVAHKAIAATAPNLTKDLATRRERVALYIDGQRFRLPAAK